MCLSNLQTFALIRTFLKARGLSLAEEALRVELQAPTGADSSGDAVVGAQDMRALIRAQLSSAISTPESATPAGGAASTEPISSLDSRTAQPPSLNSSFFAAASSPSIVVPSGPSEQTVSSLSTSQPQRPLHSSAASSAPSSPPSSGFNSVRHLHHQQHQCDLNKLVCCQRLVSPCFSSQVAAMRS